ncbi:NADPH dehydrogenase [Paenibacillus baekrokdamisoli]|uniref:NADPH dehydrogenase n=1 Tax=Paenibacillus baekrokdamisoli TaxID=1712516 RepID=A0A3G9JE82_9BACL|nr:NADPH dehydrogenase NamA [Paenibacillus baekrokdamisoli]MBB3071806.1 NADPH2 dehydrogenase [Paenibacillus baekrokdamisoli]BBH24211.1 NADPH dehydrogenase [Paenibacillus baekrokdamisoli]
MLFSEYKVRDVVLKNRIVMSPMCMYSCINKDGKITPFHLVHYTTRAVGGAGLIMVEATSVTEQGRISYQDLGIWEDGQISGLRQLVQFIHDSGSKAAIQLAHAGRKATIDEPIIAPSAIAFSDKMKTPEAMTISQIHEAIEAFVKGAQRAIEAGFDILEIHAAHGYLINEFLSPLSNKREDEYGGDAAGRYRFLSEIVSAIRAIWEGPIFVRVSASDYHEEGLNVEDYVQISANLKEQGVDLIDCSSGALVSMAPHTYPGYQVPFADKIRNEAHIDTAAVGLITRAVQAEEILQSGRADLIFLARELLRDPYWPRTAAKELGVTIEAPKQYARAW